MKILLTCVDCRREFADQIRSGRLPTSGIVPRGEFTFSLAQVQENNRYETVCPKGHHVVTTLRNLKFEILYEIGANAILDGYYREAVSSFQAGLERMYEFYVTVACMHKQVPDGMLAKAWNEVSKQSERQLGAFLFLHTVEFLTPPDILANKMVQFRNSVIHQGRIPTKVEAVQFGQAVLDVMRPVLMRAQERYAEEIEQLTWKTLDYQSVEMSRGSIVRQHGTLNFSCTSLDDYLANLTNDRAAIANLERL